MKAFFHKILELILNIVFPRRCVGCGKLDTYLCPLCLRQIDRVGQRNNPEELFVFHYSDPRIRRLIWLLKYRNIKEIADLFGRLLYELTIEELSDELIFAPATGRIVVLPVPLSRRRQKSRGYNQAEEIAKSFARHDPQNFSLRPELLIKTKETPSQVSLKDRTQRLKNLRGVFATPDKNKLRGKTVILLDDVCTTGATMNECEKIIKKAGARKIFKIAVAGG